MLYIIDGLHQSKAISSAVLGAVATGYVIAALVAGRLGDRFGLARVIFFASFVYGGGFLVGSGSGSTVADDCDRKVENRTVRDAVFRSGTNRF